jgi:large subunit ribosomal protein L15
MLTLHTIRPTEGSRKKSKRLGRGNASGKGSFCGRGMNGQNSRAGGGVPDWFEGGQTPLFRRMPKLRGFSNAKFQKKFNVVNLSSIQTLASSGITEITKQVLLDANIISKKSLPVKLLGTGEINGKVNIHVHAASQTAQSAIEKAGGTLHIISETSEA